MCCEVVKLVRVQIYYILKYKNKKKKIKIKRKIKEKKQIENFF